MLRHISLLVILLIPTLWAQSVADLRQNFQKMLTAMDKLDFETMVDLDIQYVENQSLLKDLAILFKTPFAVLKGKGAA